MGLLYISKDLHTNTSLVRMVFNFLKKQHKAKINPKKTEYPNGIGYVIEGEDIPKGDQQFKVEIEEIVPNVIAISVK